MVAEARAEMDKVLQWIVPAAESTRYFMQVLYLRKITSYVTERS
jgi:hypothetical protein